MKYFRNGFEYSKQQLSLSRSIIPIGCGAIFSLCAVISVFIAQIFGRISYEHTIDTLSLLVSTISLLALITVINEIAKLKTPTNPLVVGLTKARLSPTFQNTHLKNALELPIKTKAFTFVVKNNGNARLENIAVQLLPSSRYQQIIENYINVEIQNIEPKREDLTVNRLGPNFQINIPYLAPREPANITITVHHIGEYSEAELHLNVQAHITGFTTLEDNLFVKFLEDIRPNPYIDYE